jgi:DeoR family transcriptional regulator, glycerol-3-phosphate regulon repressor
MQFDLDLLVPGLFLATLVPQKMTRSSHMHPRERREKILELLRDSESGRLTVEDLVRVLKASPETIRRDLTQLSSGSLVSKFHGGASLPQPSGEGPFRTRMADSLRQKRAIARVAAGLFRPGDTLLVDTGSTTIVFAEELSRQTGLTVITNSVLIAQTMTRGRNGNRAFLIGGEYSDEAMVNLGALAIRQVAQFHAIHAVITVGAIEAEGAMDFTLEEAEIAHAMINQAKRLTVIADSSKLEKAGLFRVCRLDAIDRIITDARPKGPLADALSAAEVEVLIAPFRVGQPRS